jgi:ubiquinone/menaquinone biosynthesis C-methylase UbiE
MVEPREPRSRFYDGGLYARVLEPMQAGLRGWIVKHLAGTESVLDIGCGTGALAFQLADSVSRVEGVDLSPAMIEHARKLQERRQLAQVSFRLGDLLAVYSEEEAGAFDVATMVLVLHELPAETRAPVLREATRIAARVLCVDFRSPMPVSVAGLRNRATEMFAGREHFGCYRDFQRRGGTAAIAEEAGLRCEHVRHLDANTLDVSWVSAG